MSLLCFPCALSVVAISKKEVRNMEMGKCETKAFFVVYYLLNLFYAHGAHGNVWWV